MKRNQTIIFQALLIVALLFSCGKEHNHWLLLADITVLDYHTHEPIQYDVVLTYIDSFGFGQATEETDSLGSSDNAGNFKMERRIHPANQGAFKLLLYGPGGYSNSNPGWNAPCYTFSPKHKSANQKTIYLKQYRRYDLHLKNINCTGPQDTVWITSSGILYGAWAFTGCQDNTYSSSVYGCYGKFQDENITIDIKAKKNGIVTTTHQTFPLQMNTVNLLNIEY